MSYSDKVDCDRCGSTCRKDSLYRHYESSKCQRISKMFEDMRLGKPVLVRKIDEDKAEKKREYTRKYRERLREEQNHIKQN